MSAAPPRVRLDDRARLRAIEAVRRRIAIIPDFPRPEIRFRDVTPVLADPDALRLALDLQLDAIADLHGSIAKVLGIESRGFWFGIALAERLGAGFVPVRKPGKLPRATLSEEYALEYGRDRLEIHADAVAPGERVLVVDDLLATGGTADAAVRLGQRLGAEVVALAFLVELRGLGGRERLAPHRVESAILD